jgi:hypothetical protein
VASAINRQARLSAGHCKKSVTRVSTVMAQKVGERWQMPPLAKIYEAIGALGDGRVQLEDERHASVVSSDRSKTYQVELSADGREISANDNASYWQGYLGYPAIAVMLKRGLCPVRAEAVSALSGIPWNELNRRFRNDYSRTIAEVMRRAEERGFDSKMITAEAEAVLSQLREFAPLRGPRRRPARPPR